MQGELVEEVAERYAGSFVPGGPVVLEFGGDLQGLWVGEWVLEGGSLHLVVYYWGCDWGVFLFVGEFGCVGFLGCAGECEGPVFEVVGGFVHGSGFDDGADFVQ